MTRLLSVNDVKTIVNKVGIEKCFVSLVDMMRDDFSRWEDFEKMPRIATHFPFGVIELMPISDQEYYAYKYVNGHPFNPRDKKLTVFAMGMISQVKNGYPILISEMTVLTALRTAATTALASHHLARPDSKVIGIIGTGSQAEFHVLALKAVLGIETVRYYDIDPKAMTKFRNNMSGYDLEFIECSNSKEAVEGVDIIVTATADKQRLRILESDMIKPGMHINGVGGDCPGKTELDPEILKRVKIVIEFLAQSKIEGEIQNLEEEPYAELWELVAGKKPGRETNDEVTLFDSVGFAIEDYSVLKYFYQLAESMDIGQMVDIIPSMEDPKDLFGVLL